MRTMRGALLALAIGIIVGVGLTLQFGMPGRSGSPVEKGSAKPPALAKAPEAPAKPVEAAPQAPASVVAPAAGPVTVMPDFATLAERLSPVVVNISTRAGGRKDSSDSPHFRNGPGQQGPQLPFGGEGDPRDFTEPFERFFGPGRGRSNCRNGASARAS